MYRVEEVCKMLGISKPTITLWYNWEKKSIKDGVLDKIILPIPYVLKHERGKPRMWSMKQIEELARFQDRIRDERGLLSNYTNPTYVHKREKSEAEKFFSENC